MGLSEASIVKLAEPIEISKLEAFLDGAIYAQMEEKNIIGVTLSIVKDGELIFKKGYGYSNLDNKEEVDPEHTLFRIGSTSKLFTWTAVMQLVERGLLDLNEDINTYLDFKIPSTLHGSGNEPGIITLEHLLTHTSGFEDVGSGLFVRTEKEMTSLQEYLINHVPARVFPSGEVMSYSNYGTALAGYVVERVSGQSFEDYVEENIFAILDMNRSTFRQPLPERLAADIAQAYNLMDGKYYKGGFEYISGLPAGSMSSTATDMARFMIAHLQGGRYRKERILEEETIREMHRQQFTHHPKSSGMTYGFVESTFNEKRIINQGGNTFLFHTGLFLFPDENLGFFVSSTGEGIDRESLFQLFMDRYYPTTKGEDDVPSKDTRVRVKKYLGEYYPNRANLTTPEKFLRLLSPVNVSMNEEDYLLFGSYGETIQFIEEEPGFFRQRYPGRSGFPNTLSFHERPDGNILMAIDGPLTYSKASWYETIWFLTILTVVSTLLFIGTMLGWLIRSILCFFCKESKPTSSTQKIARATVVVFALLKITFLFSLVVMLADIDPAYGAPRIFFGPTPIMNFILILPSFMAILGGIMVFFTVLSWRKRYWSVFSRIHYSTLAICMLALLWLMSYNNLI